MAGGGSVDLAEYWEWVGSVMERARRELGVGEAAWSQIEQACRGNHRFSVPMWRPTPAQAEVFARTAVVEEYARWLACERGVTVETDGSVTVNSETVATLAGLPADPFEENWPQVGQPAFAMYLRCCEYVEAIPEEDGAAVVRWLTELRAFSHRFGRCGQLAVDGAIDSMVNSEYDVSDIAGELTRSGLLGAVTGASDRFDDAYRHSQAPLPAADDITDLVVTVATVRAWLDSAAPEPSVDVMDAPGRRAVGGYG